MVVLIRALHQLPSVYDRHRAALWNRNLPPHQRLRVGLAAGTGSQALVGFAGVSFLHHLIKKLGGAVFGAHTPKVFRFRRGY